MTLKIYVIMFSMLIVLNLASVLVDQPGQKVTHAIIRYELLYAWKIITI